MISTSVDFYNYVGDLRKIDKPIGTRLKQASVYLSETCDVLTPRFSMHYDETAIKNYNYCYISDWGRYYYITDWSTDSAGKMYAQLSIDVLKTYASQILASKVNVIRNQSVGMTHTVDDKYPLYDVLNDIQVKPLNGSKPLVNASSYSILLGVM